MVLAQVVPEILRKKLLRGHNAPILNRINIRKSHKISSGKALYVRSYQPKNLTGGRGGGNTPSAFRVKAAGSEDPFPDLLD